MLNINIGEIGTTEEFVDAATKDIMASCTDMNLDADTVRKIVEQIDGQLPSEGVPSKCDVVVHITHTDIDGVGCATVGALYAQGIGAFPVVVMAPAYASKQWQITTATVLKHWWSEEDIYIKGLIVSDIATDTDMIKRMNDIIQGIKDADGFRTIVVDHHETNPMVKSEIHVTDAETIAWCTSKTDQVASVLEGIYADIGEDTSDWRFFNWLKQWEKERTVSATLLLALTVFPLISKAITKEYQESAFVDVYEKCAPFRELMDTAIRYAIGVSQWDTFGWRDQPECNTRAVFDMVGLQTFMSPYDMVGVMIQLHNEVFRDWHFSFLEHEDVEMLGRLFLGKRNDAIASSGVNLLNSIVDRVSMDTRIIDRDEFINECLHSVAIDTDHTLQSYLPNKIVILPYPQVGNASYLVAKLYDHPRFAECKGDLMFVLFGWNTTVISFRTEANGTVNLARLASYLGGGGHRQASGVNHPKLSNVLKMMYTLRSVSDVPAK